MKIEETNCVTFAQTHFGIALSALAELKEFIETNPYAGAREHYGYLFQIVFHLQEGNHEVYTFLDANHYTELEQKVKADLSIQSGAIDGYLTWMSDEFIPSIMKDAIWEKLRFCSLEAFDDGKAGIFGIEENVKKANEILESLHNIRD